MKLFLIKVGKAWHTLRRDGLLRGGRRVSKAFAALFRRVGSGDVLFVTGGVGDSALYRAHHVAEELELQGFSTSVTVQDNPWLPRYADRFSVFVLHRVLATPSVWRLIDRVKAQGKEILFETDDLVYDPAYLRYMDSFQTMNTWEKKLYEHGVGGEILDDSYVRVCTTTTTFLAEKLQEKGKRVFIVPNKLSVRDVTGAEKLWHAKKTSGIASATLRIGYFSGTSSHNKDFATVTDVLVTIVRKFPHVKLVLAGPLEIESVLREFSDRIESVPYVPRSEHFANVARVDINVAPLEIGNPFCESKSELKFFEAGIVGVPTVASATRPYREAIDDGIDGFVAATTEEWVEKLTRLIERTDLRRNMGERAREKALRKYSTQTADHVEYYEYLRARVGSVGED
jgi:glycosyltransferase involved in cell wall biosynthesis